MHMHIMQQLDSLARLTAVSVHTPDPTSKCADFAEAMVGMGYLVVGVALLKVGMVALIFSRYHGDPPH